MTSVRLFHATDVFRFNPTNLDPLTETYDLNFYFSYLARWPHLFTVAYSAHPSPASTSRSPQLFSLRLGSSSSSLQTTNLQPPDAYLMGKLESSPSYYATSPHYLPFHAHITALTVAPHARRIGLARTLSSALESRGDEYNAWFVDLFVRKSNEVAQGLYRGLGYSVFRTVREYYSDLVGGKEGEGEDAYDMRKPLRRDKERKHIRENGENHFVEPEDVW